MNTRVKWIDFAKGMGIFLMIMGHMPSLPVLFREWIFSFHMPLFFFLSGYVFKHQDIFVKFKKTIHQILYPYLGYSIVCIIIDFLLFRDMEEVRNSLWMTLKGQGGFGILWFFFSLFLVQNIYNIVYKFKHKYILVFAICVVGYIMTLLSIGEFWKISTSMVAIGFFSIGEYLGKRDKNSLNVSGILLISAAALMVNIAFSLLNYNCFGKNMDVNNGIYGFLPFSFIAAIAGILFLCVLAQLFCKCLPGKLIDLVVYIGANSRDFYPLTMYTPLRLVAVCELAAIPVNGILKIGTKIVGFLVAFIWVAGKKKVTWNNV